MSSSEKQWKIEGKLVEHHEKIYENRKKIGRKAIPGTVRNANFGTGAIDPLVKLLGAGTSGERQAASRALRSLSLNPEAHNRVGVQEVA